MRTRSPIPAREIAGSEIFSVVQASCPRSKNHHPNNALPCPDTCGDGDKGAPRQATFIFTRTMKRERMMKNSFTCFHRGCHWMFELPVLIFFLSLFGIVTPKFLWKNARYAILIISVVAAIVTPTPDATTMLVFMVPMIGLYFLGIAVSAVVTRRRERRIGAPAEAR